MVEKEKNKKEKNDKLLKKQCSNLKDTRDRKTSLTSLSDGDVNEYEKKNNIIEQRKSFVLDDIDDSFEEERLEILNKEEEYEETLKNKEKKICIELPNNNRIYIKYKLEWKVKDLLKKVISNEEFRALYNLKYTSSSFLLSCFDLELIIFRNIKKENERIIDLETSMEELHNLGFLNTSKSPFFGLKDHRSKGEINLKSNNDILEQKELMLTYSEKLSRSSSEYYFLHYPELEEFFQSNKTPINQLSKINVNSLISEKANWLIYDDESLEFLMKMDSQKMSICESVIKYDVNGNLLIQDCLEKILLPEEAYSSFFINVIINKERSMKLICKLETTLKELLELIKKKLSVHKQQDKSLDIDTYKKILKAKMINDYIIDLDKKMGEIVHIHEKLKIGEIPEYVLIDRPRFASASELADKEELNENSKINKFQRSDTLLNKDRFSIFRKTSLKFNHDEQENLIDKINNYNYKKESDRLNLINHVSGLASYTKPSSKIEQLSNFFSKKNNNQQQQQETTSTINLNSKSNIFNFGTPPTSLNSNSKIEIDFSDPNFLEKYVNKIEEKIFANMEYKREIEIKKEEKKKNMEKNMNLNINNISSIKDRFTKLNSTQNIGNSNSGVNMSNNLNNSNSHRLTNTTENSFLHINQASNLSNSTLNTNQKMISIGVLNNKEKEKEKEEISIINLSSKSKSSKSKEKEKEKEKDKWKEKEKEKEDKVKNVFMNSLASKLESKFHQNQNQSQLNSEPTTTPSHLKTTTTNTKFNLSKEKIKEIKEDKPKTEKRKSYLPMNTMNFTSNLQSLNTTNNTTYTSITNTNTRESQVQVHFPTNLSLNNNHMLTTISETEDSELNSESILEKMKKNIFEYDFYCYKDSTTLSQRLTNLYFKLYSDNINALALNFPVRFKLLHFKLNFSDSIKNILYEKTKTFDFSLSFKIMMGKESLSKEITITFKNYSRKFLEQNQVELDLNSDLVFSKITFSQLPLFSSLLFKVSIFNHSKSNKKENAFSASWVNFKFFDYKKCLKTGKYLLSLHNGEFGDFSYFNFSENIISKQEILIELPSFNRLVEYPSTHSKELTEEENMNVLSKIMISETDSKIIQNIKLLNPFDELNSMEKSVLWANKFAAASSPELIPRLLQSVDFTKHEQLVDVKKVLKYATLMKPIEALQLLTGDFLIEEVRSYAVKCIKQLDAYKLNEFLIQLVQALKYEPNHYSELAKLLLDLAVKFPVTFGHTLFWCLKSEMYNINISQRYGLILEVFLSKVGKNYCKYLEDEIWLVNKLLAIADIPFYKEFKDKKKKEEMLKHYKSSLKKLNDEIQSRDEFSTIKCGSSGSGSSSISLPSNFKQRITGINYEKCKVMKSKKRPLWISFKIEDGKTENQLNIMFKKGDDLRQDILTLQIFRIMQTMWFERGINLKMSLYPVVSTGYFQGMLEMVKNSETLCTIHKLYGGFTAAFSREPLRKWLDENCNLGEREYINNFKLSCAAYCVATFVLGIGDRHNDNIMIKNNGELFHIDFGHFLGHFKYKYGIKRERAPFVFTREFKKVLGGKKTQE